MLVAYIIQVAVVLLTCVLWHCLQDWSKLGIFIHTKLWRRSEDPWISAEKSQSKLKKTKLYASFVKALAEFQKAQVFFLAAVLVAALIAWFHPTVLSNDAGQGQLDEHDQQRATAALSKNLNMFVDLAYAGAFPVVLGLLTLRNAGKRDTYTLVISTFPLILSVILLIATADQLDSQDQVAVTPSGGPESCAGVKPTDYCFPSRYTPTLLAQIGGWPLIAWFVVFFCIVLERVKLFKDHSKSPAPKRISGNQGNAVARLWRRIKDSTVHRQNIFEAVRDWALRRQRLWVRYERLVQDSRWLRWMSVIHLDTAETFVHMTVKVIVLAAEITLGAFNVVLLYEYARIIRPKEYRVSEFQVWTLGQVIAVTVWFPVLVEFIWDCYDGIAKTLESRILPDTYRVVTLDQQPAPSQDDAASSASLTCLPPITPYKALQTDPLQP
ncbi:hypothetical protein PRZ48_009732 [Zasmidium cellare]|uniref:Uncharacterized protein n=1 Tax=Zasmidium cellare TaxID=395010 RepID=A0ABR0ECI2_ZASCE|nr:hypothetical protein PRZ48_009732 [Zasmidium cellare]